MKIIIKFFIIRFFLLLPFVIHAQDYTKVDATVKNYPKTFSSLDKFVDQVNKDFKRDDEKARAIFTWIATNIKYDLPAYGVNERPAAFSFRTQEEKEAKQKKFKEDLAAKTLKSKKGVCQGYATLFAIVAEKIGLESEIIPGTSKSHPMHIGKGPGANDHAWNVVKINNEWKFVDATWGAGTVTGAKPEFVFKFNDKYFFTDPDVFFLNHFPDDKKWLLTQKTEQDFANLPLYYGTYLMDGYEFVSPKKGTIQTSKPVSVAFNVRNIKPGDKVHYTFSKDRVYKEAELKQNGDMTEFIVPIDGKSNGTLTIYVNQRSVVTYKINTT